MKRFTVSILTLIGAAVVPATSMADTFPAINGRPLVGSEEICFQGQDNSSRVSNPGCSTSPPPRWFVPAILRWTGNTVFRASSVGAGVAPTCRASVRSAGDSSIFFGALISVAGTDVNLGTANVTSTNQTAVVQCNIEQSGRALSSIRWNTF